LSFQKASFFSKSFIFGFYFKLDNEKVVDLRKKKSKVSQNQGSQSIEKTGID